MDTRPYHRIIQPLLRHVRRGPVTERDLLNRANLHQKIGGVYSRFEQPWAIPHFELARHYWEKYRSSISASEFRRHLFSDQGKYLFYGLGKAYLRESTREKETIDPVIEEDDVVKEFLEQDRLNQSPEHWIRNAFTALEGPTARVYLDQIFGDVPPATAADVETRIANSQVPLAALLCFPTEDQSEFFLIATGLCRHVTAFFGGNYLDNLQTQMRDELTHRFFDPSSPMIESTSFWKSFQESFREVIRMLLELDRDTILMVAGGEVLTNLPLAGLQLENTYLIDRHPVVFLSSISQWVRNNRNTAPPRKRLLSIGVGRQDQPAETTLSFNPLNAPCKIGKGENQLAVEHIGWNQVTKGKVTADLPHYPMALFTCHGTFYEQITTADSGLDFAGGDRLTLDEITNLDLPLDLIFMNSCVSSKSRSTRTNEPQGIPISFCIAGVDKVIGSLWNVWYPAGDTFTRTFFQGLTKAPTKFMAYQHQEAVLDTRSTHPDPYHWVGWALYGNYI